jgi:hypothetical protein
MDSSTNYHSVGKFILLVVALVLVGQTIFAQKPDSKPSKKGDKIKMKVMIEKDGQKKSFEKEYKDEKEMENDQELKAFREEMGLDDEAFLPPPPPPPGDFAYGNGMVNMDEGIRNFHFSFDSLDEMLIPPPPPFMYEDILRETMTFGHFPPDSMFTMKIEEDMFALDSLKDGEKHVMIYKGKPGEKLETNRIYTRKKISIEDVESKGSDLKLKSLNYYPNPNKGNFHLQFESSKKEPVTINVHNEKGELVYMDKVDGNDGKHDKQIDLSDKKKGIYFLELSQKGKSIRKKILVE